MRPRKKVLLVSDAMTAGQLRFVLETRRHYSVICAQSPEDAIRMMCEHLVEAVLLDADLVDVNGLRQSIAAIREAPVLIFNARISGPEYQSEAVAYKHESRIRMMEKLRVLTQRRRGPKKNVSSNIHSESKKSLAPRLGDVLDCSRNISSLKCFEAGALLEIKEAVPR